jgi:hypothetical protein
MAEIEIERKRRSPLPLILGLLALALIAFLLLRNQGGGDQAEPAGTVVDTTTGTTATGTSAP